MDGGHPDGPAVAAALGGLAAALRPLGVEARTIIRTGQRAAGEDLSAGDSAVMHLFGMPPDTDRLLQRAVQGGVACVVSPLGEATIGPYRRPVLVDRLARWLRGLPVTRLAAAVAGCTSAEEAALRAQRVHRRVELLPLGVAESDFAAPPAARGSAGRTLLVLRPLHPIDGPLALLKALADLGPAADGWQIVFGGPAVGDWRLQLEAGVRRKGAADRVRFEPSDDPATHRRLLGQASLVVSPSLHHRGDTSVAMAVAAGVPVVTTSFTAPPLPDGAIRVCSPRREDLATALHDLLTASQAELIRQGGAARETARKSLDWSVVAPRYAALYEDLAGPRGRAGTRSVPASRQAAAGASAQRD